MVASGTASSTASRRAWMLPPMTRVTREAMLSVTALLPHLACSRDDLGDLQDIGQVFVDHGRIIASGAARDGKPHDRDQQLKATLHDDFFDVDGALLGLLGEPALRQERRHDLGKPFGGKRE